MILGQIIFRSVALPFSQDVYYRLFEIYNKALWPVQLTALALGVMLPILARRWSRSRGRIISLVLAAGWLCVAWFFHLQRFAEIYWSAPIFAALFAFEAALLLWTGTIRGRLIFRTGSSQRKRAGLGIFLISLLVYPLAGLVPGLSWAQAEIAGLAPDPTALATMGMLLLVEDGPPWLLLAIPLFWCAVNGVTLWMLGSPGAISLLLAGPAVLFFALRKSSTS